MSRVLWKRREKIQVFERLVQVWSTDLNLPPEVALSRSQVMLVPERRVKISYSWIYRNRKWLDEAYNAAEKAREKRSQPAPAIDIPTPPPEPQRDPTARLVDILEQLMDALADRVAERLRPQMQREELVARVDEQFDVEYKKHNPLPLSEAKPTGLPGVLVIGLLPAQQKEIENAFGRTLDLAFMGSQEAHNRPILRRAHTVIMTRFIAHAVQEKYKKAETALQLCHGGMTGLGQILAKLSQV